MNALVRLLAGLVIAVLLFAGIAEVTAFGYGVAFRSERPPVGAVQTGSRGTGLVYVYNLFARKHIVEANQIPESVPYPGVEDQKAGEVYENLKVVGDVGLGEFTRLMVNMTKWVAPDEGCDACHNTANFAEDSKYTKIVARRMLQMTRHINADWTRHVGQTGVTCYTCHRGQRVPPNIWFNNPGPEQAGGFAQAPAGMNHPAAITGESALPYDALTAFLERSDEIRVQSTTALPSGDGVSVKQAKWTYSLMMTFSQSLGVNCDYCHDTRAFRDWSQSPPQRVTAWHGIRMARDLNKAYLDPLSTVFPSNRLGVSGDSPKVYCATCHNGVYKPLFGVSMVQDFPELRGGPAEAAK